jgi:hypothetical protein
LGFLRAAGSWSRYQRCLCSGGVCRLRARSLAHIKKSVRDDVGFIELWHDGVPQTFGEPCAGQTQCMVRTLMPGGDGVYFKQGYDRDPAITATGVVYDSGISLPTLRLGRPRRRGGNQSATDSNCRESRESR